MYLVGELAEVAAVQRLSALCCRNEKFDEWCLRIFAAPGSVEVLSISLQKLPRCRGAWIFPTVIHYCLIRSGWLM